MSRNTDVVKRLIAGWGTRDVDAITSCFTEDAVYVNVPLEPIHEGAEAIRAAVEGLLGMDDEIGFVVHHSSGNPETAVVLNERTVRLLICGDWMETLVASVFELREGRICAWRDHFGVQFQAQLES